MREVLFFLLIVIVVDALASHCHYSCATCSAGYYTQCVTCSNPNLKVNLGATCSSQLDQNILAQMGGLCSNAVYSSPNPLGIILLIAAITSFFLKSHHTIFFVISLQTLGLMALVEVNYPPILDFMLSSLQYFMTFSVMQRNSKPSNCKLMLRSMYRMNGFLGTPDFKQNSLPILPLAIVSVALLFVISMLLKHKKKRMQFLELPTWNKILSGIRSFFFLTMQQVILIIYIGIRFSPLDAGLILSIGIYCICLIYLIVDCNIQGGLPFFISTEFMNLCFIKRLVLPLMVVVPYNYTFCLILFLLASNLIDLLFLLRVKKARFKHSLYLGLQLLCIAMVGVLAITDLGNNSEGQSSLMAIIAALLLAIYCLSFSIEIILAIKKMLKGSKVINNSQIIKGKSRLREKNTASRQEHTISDLHDNEQERETKVTPVEMQMSGVRKGSDDLKVTKHPLREVRVEDIG